MENEADGCIICAKRDLPIFAHKTRNSDCVILTITNIQLLTNLPLISSLASRTEYFSCVCFFLKSQWKELRYEGTHVKILQLLGLTCFVSSLSFSLYVIRREIGLRVCPIREILATHDRFYCEWMCIIGVTRFFSFFFLIIQL